MKKRGKEAAPNSTKAHFHSNAFHFIRPYTNLKERLEQRQDPEQLKAPSTPEDASVKQSPRHCQLLLFLLLGSPFDVLVQ